jgi:NAD(P)H-nitrite reductase large subunit
MQKNGNALSVRLSNGLSVDADLVISATGVKPNIGFLQTSGITCAHGVLTDQYLQTNVPGIYAAGDCSETLDLVSGKHVVSAIQPSAADQAICAGMNMAGKKLVLRGVTQINVLDTLGLVSSSFGEWQGVPGGEHAEVLDADNYRFLRLEFGGDVLVGANSVGLTEHVGVLRGLIQSRTRLGHLKDRLLQNPLALMEVYLATSQVRNLMPAKALNG